MTRVLKMIPYASLPNYINLIVTCFRFSQGTSEASFELVLINMEVCCFLKKFVVFRRELCIFEKKNELVTLPKIPIASKKA